MLWLVLHSLIHRGRQLHPHLVMNVLTMVHQLLCFADIVYMVTGGSSLHQFYILCGGTAPMGLSAWIVVFAATELISCQVRTLHGNLHDCSL